MQTMQIKQTISRHSDWESIALPIILMITGLVLLGGDYLGMLSLERIQNLWPVALIATGLVELLPVGSEHHG